MRLRSLVLRFLCWLSLAVWVGGFTFYGAVVIPVLHDAMGSTETGYVTQRVTDAINAAGAAALAIWWLTVGVERSSGSIRIRRARLLLLAASTTILIFLVILHRIMDLRLESGSFRGFYPLHRAYLIASTVQWFANLGLVAVSLVLWWEDPAGSSVGQGSTPLGRRRGSGARTPRSTGPPG